jgi:hypothetical protein
MLRLIFCFFFYSATFGLVEWPKPLLAATADEATKNLRDAFRRRPVRVSAASAADYLAQGRQTDSRHQELYKKDFVFVNPAYLGANLTELIASYRQVFNIR